MQPPWINSSQQGLPAPPAHPPRPPRRRSTFRWSILWVPVACLLAAWFLAGVEPALTWDDVMDLLDVQERERFTKLALLGLLLVGVIAVLHILKGDENESGK